MAGGLNDLVSESGALKIPGLGDSIGNATNKELMAGARRALSGNWGTAILGYILYTVLMLSFTVFLFGSVFFVSMVCKTRGTDPALAINLIQGVVNIVQLAISGAVMVGFCSFFLGIALDGAARLENLFTGFRRFWKSFGVYFFYQLFICLWTLLFIIPGIIAAFRYAMAFYILADDEECGSLDAIRRSKEMMKGYKWKLFCLYWRFFWWGLLCLILPIGFLWLVPYMQTSLAKFYEDVK